MIINKRTLLAVIPRVRSAVSRRIARDRGTGLYATLSGEGYAGGYLDALNDMEAFLTHGHPSDIWGFWREGLKSK